LRYRGITATEVLVKTIIKMLAWLFIILLAAVVIIPLVVLAGLFVWLKLTEEADEEALELEQEMEMGGESQPA
jgi:uncharacterized metal-binding protein